MAVTVSPCLGGCLGVDENGLPANRIDPAGHLECGPNGLRAVCYPIDLGLVAVGGHGAAALGQAIPANTDVIVTDGVNPWLARSTWTNTSACQARVHIRTADLAVEGVNMPLNSQSSPSRVELQWRLNGGPWTVLTFTPYTPTMTIANGWRSFQSGYIPPQLVAPGGTVTIDLRGLVRSSVPTLLDARSSGIAFEAWRLP